MSLKALNENGWAALTFVRYVSLRRHDIESLLSLFSNSRRDPTRVVEVDLTGRQSFSSIAKRFYKEIGDPSTWSTNPDALKDVLTDLPKGRYLFIIRGISSLSDADRQLLELVLRLRREGGKGYSTGSALFVQELPE